MSAVAKRGVHGGFPRLWRENFQNFPHANRAVAAGSDVFPLRRGIFRTSVA